MEGRCGVWGVCRLHCVPRLDASRLLRQLKLRKRPHGGSPWSAAFWLRSDRGLLQSRAARSAVGATLFTCVKFGEAC